MTRPARIGEVLAQKTALPGSALARPLDSALEPDALKGQRVLDIGSGVGQRFNWLGRRGVDEIVGIDPRRRTWSREVLNIHGYSQFVRAYINLPDIT